MTNQQRVLAEDVPHVLWGVFWVVVRGALWGAVIAAVVLLTGCADTIVSPTPVTVEDNTPAPITKYDGVWRGRFGQGSVWWDMQLHFAGDSFTGGLYLHNENEKPLSGSEFDHLAQWYPFLVLSMAVTDERWTAVANISGTWTMRGQLTHVDTMRVNITHGRPESMIFTLTRHNGFPKR